MSASRIPSYERPIKMTWAPNLGALGNLGDMLSPLIIAALTGRQIAFRPHFWPGERLTALGTIGHSQVAGTVHVWGTGFQSQPRHRFSGQARSMGWRFTRYNVHAIRGPLSAQVLRLGGYSVPDIFGDPAWFLPGLWPDRSHKTIELGVLLHKSEIDQNSMDIRHPPFERYKIPTELAGSIKLFSLQIPRSVAAIANKIAEILSCKRILSTSLHGLVLAETYGIPCAAFDFHDGDSGRVRPFDESGLLDHRIRDFYAGLTCETIPVLRQKRHLRTDWDGAIRFIDTHWSPADRYDPERFLAAFPEQLGPVRAEPVTEIQALEDLVNLNPLYPWLRRR